MDARNEQIFYDKKNLRWRYSRRTAIVTVAFLVAIFTVGLGSIVIRPVLPQLNLQRPLSQYRGAPNVPKNINNAASAATANYVPYQFPATPIGRVNSVPPKVIAFYVNWDDNSLTSLKSNIFRIDELMPEWLHLGDGNGEILVDDQDRQDQAKAFIDNVRPKLPIAVLINNFNQTTQDWDSGRLAKMLSDPQARTMTIDQLLKIIRRNGFVGVNVDFESVPDAQQNNLGLFMQELFEKLHPLHLEVSQSVPLDDDSYDTKKLSQSSDFLVFMAYDQNSVYDTLAGPVASQPWYASKLAFRMAQISPAKTVVAVGGYGYDWEGDKIAGTELSFQDAMSIAKESQSAISLDKDSLNPTFDYYDDDNALHHVWFLDATTLFNEILAGKKLGGPRGYALWRLGSEDPSVWNVFGTRNTLDKTAAQSLATLEYGYDIDYEGDGEIFRVTQTPHAGKRSVAYDPASGFITDEKIQTFPSSYVITRWGGYDKKKIAITFDDGPSKEYTPKILDILKKYKVPATFFVIGSNANDNQDILRRELAEGHEIGNHTYTHPNISLISAEQFRVEIDATERLFEGILGRKSLLFRPPYSEDIAPTTPDHMPPLVQTNKLGYYTMGMNIDPNDWSRPGTDEIVSRVLSDASRGVGSIVLLHDAGGNRQQTVDALPKIIEGLRSQGYQLVSASDLMGLSRDAVMPEVTPGEQLVARINGSAFVTLSTFNHFLYVMFLVGIVLGVLRLLFVVPLAIAEWIHSRLGKFRAYAAGYNPSVDVIIPAYNEEKVIGQTVHAILRSTYPNYNIVVVDDGSKDRTYTRAIQMFADNPKVTVYTKENGGKAAALNYGIARSDGEIIVTLDADTLFLHDTLEKLIRKFVDRRIGAVAGNAKVGNRINLLTRWQALEYITSQNLDRRAFEIINCITVVPGAVGAWRRSALLEAGGFSNRTLAEDADLTFSILENRHRVAYDDEAIGYTEAPDTVKNFIRQRFRWMYGTLQTVWKHRGVFLRPRYRALGFFSIPNVLVFQIFFPLISPLMDLMLVFSLVWTFWQRQNHQVDFSNAGTLRQILIYYLFFAAIDLLTAAIPFLLERKEKWSLLVWMPLQRFYYRQLMYYVAIKSVMKAIKGTVVVWGRNERKATVQEESA